MLWYYQLAVNGRLASPTGGDPIENLTITNQLPLPVTVWWLDPLGQRNPWATLQVGFNQSYTQASGAAAGTWFLVTSTLTGSFVCALQAQAGNASYNLTPSLLCDPNDIGPFPRSYSGSTIIPPDSPRVLVGCGWSGSGPVLREQYWERMSDSYCLAPNEVQRFSTTTTEGSQSTASTQTDVSASLGLSASAGWGPVSASVSSSLSTSTSTLQQVTVTAENTAYSSDTLTNSTSVTQMFLRWQLTDVITLFSMATTPAGFVPTASIIMGENPVLTAPPVPVEQVNQPG